MLKLTKFEKKLFMFHQFVVKHVRHGDQLGTVLFWVLSDGLQMGFDTLRRG
jgi:hypothetical protein